MKRGLVAIQPTHVTRDQKHNGRNTVRLTLDVKPAPCGCSHSFRGHSTHIVHHYHFAQLKDDSILGRAREPALQYGWIFNAVYIALGRTG